MPNRPDLGPPYTRHPNGRVMPERVTELRSPDLFKPDIRKTEIDPNFWYPVAQSGELKPGKTLAVAFAGDPIVLVRSVAGKLFALEDRCAHRQVPLHAGVVKGDCLQCCYHGWSYDAAGHCINVPYLDKERVLPNGVRAYPTREAYGLIFVFPGDADAATVPFPDLPSYADPHYKTRHLDRVVECHYSFMHENLMDMNHQFMHRRLMGKIRTTFLDLRRFQDRVEVDYTFWRSGGKTPVGERLMIGRPNLIEEGRSGDLMTITTAYPYQILHYWPSGAKEPALDLWNVYVPLDAAQRTNRTFGLMMIRKPGIPGLINLMWPFIIWFTEGIFREDRWIVEQEQKAFDRQGQDENQEIFPAIQALRALLIERGLPACAAEELAAE